MDPSLKIRLRQEILTTLAVSDVDWRSTQSLVEEMRQWEADRSDVVGALDHLWREDKIRHPWGWGNNYQEHEYWRTTERPMTKGEKRRRWFAVFGMSTISDGSYDGGNF